MSSFVPAQFSSFTSGFDFDKLRTDTTSSFHSRWRSLKPPQDFFDYRRISKPNGVYDIQTRIAYNLSYFSSNYILIVAIISIYFILTNLPLFFLLAFDAASILGVQKAFHNAEQLDLRFMRVTKSSIYTTLIVINLPILFYASPFSTLIWLVSVSSVVVFSHAALMEKPLEAAYADVV